MAAIIPAGSVMSWMQSNVVTRSSDPSLGSGSSAGVVERGVGQPGLGEPLAGPDQGELRDVVAGDGAGRERLGQQQHGAARPAADVGDAAPRGELVDDAVERRQHRRHQVGAVPRLEAALHADRRLRPVAVVVVAEPVPEAVRQHVERRHHLREVVEHPDAERLVACVGEHGDGLG